MAYIGNKVNGGLADGNAVVSGTLDVSNNVTLSADVTIGDDLVLTDDLFFGTDATVINFGADNDVTLTHVHDTGILLNSSKQLQFGDSGTYIRQSSDGVLNLVADGDMVITADGVVIGASSTATVFEATGSKNDQWAGKFTNTNSGGYGVLAVTAGSTANEKAFEVRKNTSDTAMLIQGDGNVGIGTSSPNATLELSNSSSIPSISLGRSPFSTHGSLTIGGTGTGHLTSNTDSSGDSTVAVAAARISIGNGTIQFLNSGSTSAGSARTFSETMRIDSSGNLLVGQSSTELPGAGNTTTGISVSGEYDAIFASRSAGSALVVNRNSDGEIAQFRKDGSTVGSIGTQSGTLQIDGTSGSTGLLFGASNIYPRDNGANSDGGVDLGGSSIRFKDFYLSGKITGATQVTQDDNTSSLALAGGTDSNVGANMIVYGGSHSSLDGVVRFRNGSTNTARIDSSGNLMVGRTSLGISNTGHTLAAAGYVEFTRDGAAALNVGRNSSAGATAVFWKDGNEAGTIGSAGGSANEIFIHAEAGKALLINGNGLLPGTSTGGGSDNTTDLGQSDVRFDDVFATNGTIQTSDENEKQDIASMTTAELAVGKRLSALFKTFRWKDKVTEKADKARTHSGIVAQQVKAAFEAEGLDATKYALFCSDTWTNDDGKEQTRMGVRYPELLSFIASYNESRFTAIEARIAKLEE